MGTRTPSSGQLPLTDSSHRLPSILPLGPKNARAQGAEGGMAIQLRPERQLSFSG